MSEGLGRIHFWGTILGAYATFLPMHITGLEGEPRHYAQLTGIPGQAGHLMARPMLMQTHITYGAIFLALAQIPFLVNLVLSFRNGSLAGENPWDATTMEWKPGLFLADETSAEETISAFRAPCDYRDGNNRATFQPQWVSESLAE